MPILSRKKIISSVGKNIPLPWLSTGHFLMPDMLPVLLWWLLWNKMQQFSYFLVKGLLKHETPAMECGQHFHTITRRKISRKHVQIFRRMNVDALFLSHNQMLHILKYLSSTSLPPVSEENTARFHLSHLLFVWVLVMYTSLSSEINLLDMHIVPRVRGACLNKAP